MTTPAPTASEAVTDETIIRSLVASRSEAEQLVAIEDMRGGGEMVVTLEDLRAILALQPAMSGATPAGYKLVPIEPTDAMLGATYVGQYCSDIWRDMLEAAPSAPIEAAQPASSSAVTALVYALCEDIQSQNPPLNASKSEQFAEGFASGMRTAAKRIANEIRSQA